MGENEGKKGCYYTSGSTEDVQPTPVVNQRLERRRVLTKNSTRLVIALVGLPARGKSFVARKIEHYMNWSGYRCKIFNVGRYRRQAYAIMQEKELQQQQNSDGRKVKGACDANFFDANNTKAAELREAVAEIALLDMLKWLDEDEENSDGEDDKSLNGSISDSKHSAASFPEAKLNFKRRDRIAIFDATNSTQKRRQWLLERCTSPEDRRHKPTGVVFVESLCDDQELLEENYNYKISNSPDFNGMTKEEALADLKTRVRKYEEQYETVADDSMSYIKIYNLSTKILMNHIYGRMAKELVPALMSWHIGTRPVFLCRPGETIQGIFTDGEDYVAKNKIDTNNPAFLDLSRIAKRRVYRGDSLGPRGIKFRTDLLDFCYQESHVFMVKRSSVHDMVNTGTSVSGLDTQSMVHQAHLLEHDDTDDHHRDPFPLRLLSSTMPRAIDTVNWEEFEFHINQTSNLNPLDKGDFVGMELEEIRAIDPAWYAKLQKDPFGTRFPGGEAYRDLIRRLASVVIDVEQQVIPTLVVSHVSVLQCLMAYFRNTPVEQCMSIDVPMHTVIEYTPVRGGGWRETRHCLDETVAAVSAPPVLKKSTSGGGVVSKSSLSMQLSELSGTDYNDDEQCPIWGDGMPKCPTSPMPKCPTSPSAARAISKRGVTA